MAANVLNSPHAIQMSVFVIRAFVRLRHIVTTHKELAAKLLELEHTVASHDGDIKTLFDAHPPTHGITHAKIPSHRIQDLRNPSVLSL